MKYKKIIKKTLKSLNYRRDFEFELIANKTNTEAKICHPHPKTKEMHKVMSMKTIHDGSKKNINKFYKNLYVSFLMYLIFSRDSECYDGDKLLFEVITPKNLLQTT